MIREQPVVLADIRMNDCYSKSAPDSTIITKRQGIPQPPRAELLAGKGRTRLFPHPASYPSLSERPPASPSGPLLAGAAPPEWVRRARGWCTTSIPAGNALFPRSSGSLNRGRPSIRMSTFIRRRIGEPRTIIRPGFSISLPVGLDTRHPRRRTGRGSPSAAATISVPLSQAQAAAAQPPTSRTTMIRRPPSAREGGACGRGRGRGVGRVVFCITPGEGGGGPGGGGGGGGKRGGGPR